MVLTDAIKKIRNRVMKGNLLETRAKLEHQDLLTHSRNTSEFGPASTNSKRDKNNKTQDSSDEEAILLDFDKANQKMLPELMTLKFGVQIHEREERHQLKDEIEKIKRNRYYQRTRKDIMLELDGSGDHVVKGKHRKNLGLIFGRNFDQGLKALGLKKKSKQVNKNSIGGNILNDVFKDERKVFFRVSFLRSLQSECFGGFLRVLDV